MAKVEGSLGTHAHDDVPARELDRDLVALAGSIADAAPAVRITPTIDSGNLWEECLNEGANDGTRNIR